jgi:hypothetical protein
MPASARHVCAYLCAAALLCGAAPVAASDRPDTPPAKPSVDLTLAGVALVPPVAAITPALLAEAAQRPRPLEIAVPKSDGGIIGATALRRSTYVSYSALQVLDFVSTRQALTAGAREANPAMAGIVKSNAAMFAVKAGTAAATAIFAERLAKNHPRRATIMMLVLNGAYAAIVAHNYQVARGR